MNSPPSGLQKLKMENGYVKNGHVGARLLNVHRRYTIGAGHIFRHESRHGGAGNGSSGKTSSGSRGSNEKNQLISGKGARVSSGGGDQGNNYGRSGTSSTVSRGIQEKKPVNREEQRDSSANGGGGNASVRTSSIKSDAEDGKLVDGWPKWLTDNIPKAALEGLTPRSAETYDKIDKVSLSS